MQRKPASLIRLTLDGDIAIVRLRDVIYQSETQTCARYVLILLCPGTIKLIEEASVLVVVAGMEGALPSVVAGMVGRPVIAVPTSVGYGVSFGGLTALFAMLNSCSSNVAVVNIDNGFGAGYMASIINRI